MFRQLIEAICFRLVNGPLGGGSPAFHVSRLDLRPGDILVLRFKQYLAPNVPARIKADLADVAKGHRVMILDNGADLAVLTAAEIEERSKPKLAA